MPRNRRNRQIAALLASLTLGLALGACAERARFVNPNVPQEQWSLDRNACRQQADELAARQLDNDLASDSLTGATSSVSQQLAVQDARRLRQRLYARCLGARGYEPRGE